MAKTKALGALRTRILDFRDKREQVKELDKEVKEAQPEIIASMRNVDPINAGIIIDPDDKSRGTAYVQQNDPSEVWDEEAILEYIKGKSALKKNVTTTVLDMRKWEAEVAAGNVPAKIAKGMKYKQQPPVPFIRFGKAGENSK
jgi:hypothetical protein